MSAVPPSDQPYHPVAPEAAVAAELGPVAAWRRGALLAFTCTAACLLLVQIATSPVLPPLAATVATPTTLDQAAAPAPLLRPKPRLDGPGQVAKPPPDAARRTVDAMNRAGFWSDGSAAIVPWSAMRNAMGPFLADDFVYDFIYPWVEKQRGIQAWYEGEFSAWNRGFPRNAFVPFIEVGDASYVSYASYMLSEWRGPFAGVPPVNRTVRVRDLDFYLVRDGKIVYNWCMVDVINLLQQAGYSVLPPSPLPDDPLANYLPSSSMDGMPAPLKAFVSPGDTKRAERIVRAALRQDFLDFHDSASSWHSNMTWYGPAGIGTASSRQLYVTHFLAPLHRAFNDPQLAIDVLVCEGLYCAAHVYLRALHVGPWLGQQASGRRIALRMGLHFRVAGGHIAEGWSQVDLLSALAQMGSRPLEQIAVQP